MRRNALQIPVMHVGSSLLAPGLTVIGYMVEQSRSMIPLDVSSMFTVILGFVLISAPYLYLSVRVRKLLEDMC